MAQNTSFFSKHQWKQQLKSRCFWSLWVLKKLCFYLLNEPWETGWCSAATGGQTLFRNLVSTHSFLLAMGIKAFDLIVNMHFKENLSTGKLWFPTDASAVDEWQYSRYWQSLQIWCILAWMRKKSNFLQKYWHLKVWVILHFRAKMAYRWSNKNFCFKFFT